VDDAVGHDENKLATKSILKNQVLQRQNRRDIQALAVCTMALTVQSKTRQFHCRLDATALAGYFLGLAGGGGGGSSGLKEQVWQRCNGGFQPVPHFGQIFG
jgi:hypothetical protein